MEIGGVQGQPGHAHIGRRVVIHQVDFVPVNAQVGDNADLARGGKKLAGRSTAIGFGLPEGMPMSSTTVFQLPAASFT